MKGKLLAGLFICLSAGINAQPVNTPKEKIHQLVKAYADNKLFSGAVLVAEKGNVIYKNGFGLANREWNIPNTTNTKFRVGSITKQFTSMVIMQLVNEGKIKLDEKITAYLPD